MRGGEVKCEISERRGSEVSDKLEEGKGSVR